MQKAECKRQEAGSQNHEAGDQRQDVACMMHLTKARAFTSYHRGRSNGRTDGRTMTYIELRVHN